MNNDQSISQTWTAIKAINAKMSVTDKLIVYPAVALFFAALIAGAAWLVSNIPLLVVQILAGYTVVRLALRLFTKMTPGTKDRIAAKVADYNDEPQSA